MIAVALVSAVLLVTVAGEWSAEARASALAGSTSGSPYASARSQSIAPSGAPSRQSAVPGSELTIYLMTMGYGDLIWERFGHNAIRIVDGARGTDSVYHWGTFDFQQPNFLRRFMTGNTLYWMQGEGMAETMEMYRYRNRSVWEQELDLTPAERIAVRDFITWNAKEENRYYRYDYYLDNCSTRVRDVIDRIVGGQLRAATEGRLTSTTYRFHTQRALQFDRAVALGTDIGLGAVADRPISQWAEAFLPTRLQEHVRSVQVKRADGTVRPLVKAEQQIFTANRPAEPAGPPSTLFRNLLIGVGVAAVLALLGRAAAAGRRGLRVAFVTVATIWTAINGLLGVILIFGWTATRHVFMARNENLLQFDPLSLGLAALLPLAIMRGRAVDATRRLALAIGVISVLGLAMKVVPLFDQTNLAVIALTLPAHLTVAWAVRALTLASPVAPSPRRASAASAVARSAA